MTPSTILGSWSRGGGGGGGGGAGGGRAENPGRVGGGARGRRLDLVEPALPASSVRMFPSYIVINIDYDDDYVSYSVHDLSPAAGRHPYRKERAMTVVQEREARLRHGAIGMSGALASTLS